MGWSPFVDEQGRMTGEFAGDEVYDVLGAAFAQVVAIYQERYRRPPTQDEINQAIEFTRPRGDQIFDMFFEPAGWPKGVLQEQAEQADGRRINRGIWVGLGLFSVIVLLALLMQGCR